MGTGTAIRPTATATAIRPITAATTGLTTAGMVATTATASRGGRHPLCLLAPRKTPRSLWRPPRCVASTAPRLQVRRRLRLALIRLSGYRDASLQWQHGEEHHLGPVWVIQDSGDRGKHHGACPLSAKRACPDADVV